MQLLALDSTLDVYGWIIIAVLIVILFLLRICMKNYVPSIIMCFIFSIATITLSIFAITSKTPLDYGPWIF